MQNQSLLGHPVFRNMAVSLITLLVVLTAVKIVSDLKEMKYIGSGAPATNTISVSGKGEVIAPPDIATFTFSVTEEGASVPEAQKKATDKMNAILAYVKKSGVEERDVKTASYNIYPRYEYHPISANSYGGKQVLAAYVVSQTIELKVRNLDNAGTLLSGIGEYGATDVSGLTFSVDNQDVVTRQARDKAITDAREQAEVLAKSLGVSLGRIVSFSEAGNYPQPIYYAKAMDSRVMGMGGGESAPAIPTGENKITSNVSITYEIK